MSLQVKICGVRRPADVAACLAAGADWVGLNFAPRSRRCLALPQARELAALLPPGVGVAVFQDADLQTVLDVVAATGIGVVQLHGALPPGLLGALRGRVRVFRALGAAELSAAPGLAPAVAAFLVDSPRPGSGQPWDWGAVLDGPRLAGRPVLLAGGLAPETVGAAVRRVRPAGVDVASGVEGPDGQQCPDRIHAFVRAARSAAQEAR